LKLQKFHIKLHGISEKIYQGHRRQYAMLSGAFITIVQCVLRMQMEEMVSDMDSSCEHVEQAVMHSQQEVHLQLGVRHRINNRSN